jgi:hypothetical protein
MRTQTLIVLLLMGSSATPVWAQQAELQARGADGFDEAWIDRPLVLSPGMVQAGLSLDVTNMALELPGRSVTGETMGVELDVGVAPRLELGLALTVPVNPAAFGSAVADVQLALAPPVSLRVDAGLTRASVVASSESDGANLFVFGLGVPIKVKLLPQLALVSGRTGSAGFGRPLAVADDSGGLALGTNPFYQGDSLVAFTVDHNGDVTLVANAPIGVMVTPLPRLALVLRGGYRYIQFSHLGQSVNALPFGGDLLVSLPGHVDAGVSADVAGILDTASAEGSFFSGYLDYRQFVAFVKARFY